MKRIEISEIKVLPYQVHSAEINMATDRYLLGVPGTFLRLYGWDVPTLSFGRMGKGWDEIDLDYCRQQGIRLVKRLSGGKTVLHDRELTYALVSDTELFPDSVVDTYRVISRILMNSFGALGLKTDMSPDKGAESDSTICFRETSAYELTVDAKKLVGSAQYRKRNRFFQHGSILLDIDWQSWKRIWKLPDDSTDLEKRITSIRGELGQMVDPAVLAGKITHEFSCSLNAVITEWNPDQIACEAIEELSRKYAWQE